MKFTSLNLFRGKIISKYIAMPNLFGIVN